jgi:GT2 family glycosyltransferase|tara:strand:+ start:5011 stop:5772 length:762 start_codon:yes stop_codon:yes gene_type:complete
MNVSVFNIVSDALDMLKFSSSLALKNAGQKVDYIVICWKPREDVLNWIKDNNFEYHLYQTNNNLNFIQNLRNCFNLGFEKCFERNDYACGINTDMAFYDNWLVNLVKYAEEDRIINCNQIEPGVHKSLHTTKNFGVTIEGKFDMEGFNNFCSEIYQDKLLTEEEWGRRADATPHLMHRNVWKHFGPWQVKIVADIAFFDKAKAGGIHNMKSLGSMVYHYGAVETKRVEDKQPILRLRKGIRHNLRGLRDKYLK